MRLLPRLLLTALALGVLCAQATPPAQARRSSRTSFRSKTAGIQIFLPGTWQRQMRSAFPGVLATFKHKKLNARITLAVKRRASTETATGLAEKNGKVLKARKWTVGSTTATRLGRKLPAVELVATGPKGKLQVRQLYAVRGQFAYILTLVTPPSLAAKLRSDFLYVLKSTRFAR